MSSPTRRMSGAGFFDRGPPQSVLQKLLEEISSHNNTTLEAVEAFTPSYGFPRSRTGSVARPQHHGSSVWVGGGSAAEDARKKLRAFDEARLRGQSAAEPGSAPQEYSHSIVLGRPPTIYGNAQKKTTTMAFNDVHFSQAAKFSAIDLPSPTSESPSAKRERSATGSPDLGSTPKKQRPCTPPRKHSGGRKQSWSDNCNTIMRGGGSFMISPPYPPHPSFTERPRHARSASSGSPEQRAIALVSSFRPVTPRRSFSPFDGVASPPQTPAWMRPLHLVDDEKSIFMNVHEDRWRDHPLCLDCFRRHGNFHRVLQFGCEVCGRDDVLKGHYWEASHRE